MKRKIVFKDGRLIIDGLDVSDMVVRMEIYAENCGMPKVVVHFSPHAIELELDAEDKPQSNGCAEHVC